ncbi:microfibrillar-associated protein 1, partial [Lecanoromycetidae sp. Uapishka_2]
MASKRMTANPVKPARYRPGKAVAEESSSEDEEDGSDEPEEDDDGRQTQQTQQSRATPPKATSFPSDATKIARNLKNVDLNERRRQAAAKEAARLGKERAERAAEEEGFVTEESEEEEDSHEESGSESGSGSEESSSEDEGPKKLLRPTFIKKEERDTITAAETQDEGQRWAEEEARRKEKADAMIQEQLEKDAAARAAGKKDWDDDDVQEVEIVDDTDDLDPETERAAWKLRELQRVKRDRDAIETAEKEREEVERRRNLSKEEREAEDKEFLEGQKEEREGKGKIGYMQKYFHKGAFFQDDAKAEGLDKRDIMGSRFEDATNREILPQYMQVRDMTKLGRKGGTKYKDLRSEDTGQWGRFDDKGPRKFDGSLDERFRPDNNFGGKGASGANTTQVGQRKRALGAPEGAPSGPRAAPPLRNDETRQRSPQRRFDSRSRSPPRRKNRSYSRSPPPRRDRRRERSYSYSKSPSPRRDRYREDPPRRKRSPSPYRDRYGSDKRRRLDAS